MLKEYFNFRKTQEGFYMAICKKCGKKLISWNEKQLLNNCIGHLNVHLNEEEKKRGNKNGD